VQRTSGPTPPNADDHPCRDDHDHDHDNDDADQQTR